MGCLPVRGDNPQALASGLSYVQVDKHGITILYHLHQCRPCTSQDISLGKQIKIWHRQGDLYFMVKQKIYFTFKRIGWNALK